MICPTCAGSGELDASAACPRPSSDCCGGCGVACSTCGGTGEVSGEGLTDYLAPRGCTCPRLSHPGAIPTADELRAMAAEDDAPFEDPHLIAAAERLEEQRKRRANRSRSEI